LKLFQELLLHSKKKIYKMNEMDTRDDVTRIYKNSIPILIGLSLLTYEYNLIFLSQVYLGTAMYFALLISVGDRSDTSDYE
jgi:hypothetical protein